jgi:uracil-DNA glycosylase
MTEFDPGPPAPLAQHLANVPSYAAKRDCFWYDWGPVFYRGRLDRSARVLGIASDPGPTERIACRTLVGDAGQRVQGLLAKLGLTRSYLLVNAYAYALLPSKAPQARPLLSEAAHRGWRNAFYDGATGPELQAIVAFGAEARAALELWTSRPDVPTFEVPHPSSRDAARLVDEWRAAVQQLRALVTPDPDGTPVAPNYGSSFRQSDYARVPPRDLPFGVPVWLGDDAWGRTARPRHNNSVERPSTDLKHTLVWRAPDGQP